jgi:predicted Zn-dependent peptidase
MAMMMMRRRRRRRRRRVILAGGLIAFGAYKISQKDVDRVEQSTGKSAEELTDEEVEKAMDDLNIEKQEMTDAEFDQVDKADAAEDDYIKELERLSELHDNGVLTDEEFEAKKKQLLDI